MTALPKRKQSALSEFSRSEKRGLYKAIYKRRDIRDFLPDPISNRLLRKLLDSAHHAGSVGFMQPWSFIVVRSPEVKKQVKQVFEQANAAAAKVFEGKKRELYSKLKLEGILDAPVNLCVTCDPNGMDRTSWGGTRFVKPMSTARVAPFRIYGWPLVAKASASDG